MRILLANFPWITNGRIGVKAGSRWPFTSLPEGDGRIHYIPFPFFLAYATSLLKKEGKEARLFDAIAEGLDEQKVIEEAILYDPELIIIESSTPSFNNDIRISREILRKIPDCSIAFCGPHASIFPEHILNEHDFIDYILVGEYEYTLLDLVEHMESGQELGSIPGLVYREDAAKRINSRRPTIDDLDNLPWPERGDVPIYKYNDGFAGLPSPNVQIWTSRGCPFECIFCLWPQTIYMEHKYRKRNPVVVVDEMEWLIRKFGFKAVYFDDDIFNADRDHVLGICKEIKERKIMVPWAAMARADLMDKELLEYMADSGLYALKYGIESGSPAILDFCKKRMNLEKTLRTIKLTKKLGIKVHLSFCLGFPGETKQSIQETSRFIMDAQPHSLQFSFATPFPGTEYFKYMQDNRLLLSRDWSDYDGNYKCITRTEELSSRELEKIMSELRVSSAICF